MADTKKECCIAFRVFSKTDDMTDWRWGEGEERTVTTQIAKQKKGEVKKEKGNSLSLEVLILSQQ